MTRDDLSRVVMRQHGHKPVPTPTRMNGDTPMDGHNCEVCGKRGFEGSGTEELFQPLAFPQYRWLCWACFDVRMKTGKFPYA